MGSGNTSAELEAALPAFLRKGYRTMRLNQHPSRHGGEDTGGSAGSPPQEEEKKPKRRQSTARRLTKTVSQEVIASIGLKGI